ncbi:MAG: hypothetical protein IJT62_02365 [Oscillospiraceae bacterium]|nr:hypothetical protein [Oscillospiraceae bacterium]
MENKYQENVDFTPEGFKKAVESLDFLPPEAAQKLAAALAVAAKRL